MLTALIGSSGFVGGTLARQRHFDHLYRSTNITEIAGRSYDLIVCAGAPGVKWRANQQPDQDWASIELLIRCLDKCSAARFVLISTVDVYPLPQQVDEDTAIDVDRCHPYGKHRLLLERFVAGRFPEHHILRLPALFGPGLRKNFLFDLLHHNCLDRTDWRSRFQFYDIRHLWRDCEWCIGAGLRLLNVSVEPLQAGEVAQRCFGIDFRNETNQLPIAYDMHSKHAARFNGLGSCSSPRAFRATHRRDCGPYLYSAEETVSGIRSFVLAERRAA